MSARLLLWFVIAGGLLAAGAPWLGPESRATAAEEQKVCVLIVAGPSKHPPGTHEAAATARLLAHLLEHAKGIPPVRAAVMSEWPADSKVLEGVATVVFTGDLFPAETLKDPAKIKTDLAAMAARGCGMVCLHFATGLRAQHMDANEDHPLLRWIGGCFYKGSARVCSATLVPEKIDHPVLRGWKAFTFGDEPYWNNYFGKDGPARNVTPLVTAMLPPEKPTKQTVAWAVERSDGGRGVGIVVPHFYRSWKIDDLRALVLNAICWTAKIDIPAEGVQSALPDLASFKPAAVEPPVRPAKKQPPGR